MQDTEQDGEYMETLDNCNAAMELRLAMNNDDSMVALYVMRKESRLDHTELLQLKMSYDVAVSDLHASFDLVVVCLVSGSDAALSYN